MKRIAELQEQTQIMVNYTEVSVGNEVVIEPGLLVQPSFMPMPIVWAAGPLLHGWRPKEEQKKVVTKKRKTFRFKLNTNEVSHCQASFIYLGIIGVINIVFMLIEDKTFNI